MKIALEPDGRAIALRCREENRSAVVADLRSLGRVKRIAPHDLILVEFDQAGPEKDAWKRLERWVAEGAVLFATPVLREPESRARQILTDEITVRFKSPPDDSHLRALEKEYGVRVAGPNEFEPRQFIVTVPGATRLATMTIAGRLSAAKNVEFATPNFVSTYRR